MRHEAKVLEEVKVVLVCLTEKYKGSPKCRTGCCLSCVILFTPPPSLHVNIEI